MLLRYYIWSLVLLTCQDGDDCLFEIRHVGQVYDLGVNHQDLAEVAWHADENNALQTVRDGRVVCLKQNYFLITTENKNRIK